MTLVNPIPGPGKLTSLKAVGDRLSRPKTAEDTSSNAIAGNNGDAIPADHALVPLHALVPSPSNEDHETISAALAAQAGYVRGNYVNILI